MIKGYFFWIYTFNEHFTIPHFSNILMLIVSFHTLILFSLSLQLYNHSFSLFLAANSVIIAPYFPHSFCIHCSSDIIFIILNFQVSVVLTIKKDDFLLQYFLHTSFHIALHVDTRSQSVLNINYHCSQFH